ncbi:hypothetical protein MRY82_08580 [bacterium]|nr:hypothetical protein [bacterium]
MYNKRKFKHTAFLFLYALFIVVYITEKSYANQKNKPFVGIFVNSKTFDGKDPNQLSEYNNLIQRLSIHSQNFTLKAFPIKNIRNDALILAKAALDQVQTMAILRKISPNYIAVSLWDVQNYELIGESAFENMGNRKLINDFSDWFRQQNQKQYRSGLVDPEVFALQLIEQKKCSLLKKYIPKTKLNQDKQSQLVKDCELRESFNQLLSGKKEVTPSKITSPAQIKMTTNPYDEQLTQQWATLYENSLLQQNLGEYNISNLNFVIQCNTDPCSKISLQVDIISYSHINFRTQYRLSSFILDLINQAQKNFPNKDLNAGAEVTFYHEYTPINSFHVSGTVDKPNIVTKETP